MESPASWRSGAQPLRMAFVGPRVWLDGCTPPASTAALQSRRFETTGLRDAGAEEELLARVRAFAPGACVVFGPSLLPVGLSQQLPGIVLGVLLGGVVPEPRDWLSGIDRVVSFAPALSEDSHVWRAVPPPVSDAIYAPVRELAGRPRAISIGRSTRHREHMLTPAKHHHDLLQVIHGVSGAPLAELLSSCDVGVHVTPERGGGYGPQVGLHLAAGQLLLSEQLAPAHGLECDIDYLQFDSPEGLVWMLERLASFPEMHRRVRVRGRMKAEQYRASRVFARLGHDLLADVAAFG